MQIAQICGNFVARGRCEHRSPAVDVQPMASASSRRFVFMSNVMQILNSIEQSDAEASDRLLPLVYNEL